MISLLFWAKIILLYIIMIILLYIITDYEDEEDR